MSRGWRRAAAWIGVPLAAGLLAGAIVLPRAGGDGPGGPATRDLPTCAGCHSRADRAVRSSAHGKANVDCVACHTFSTRLSPDPDAHVRGRFFTVVTADACGRCHGSQVEQWLRGRHVHPLNAFFDRLAPGRPRDARYRTSVTLSVKAANPCLVCHEAHAFKPGVERLGGDGGRR